MKKTIKTLLLGLMVSGAFVVGVDAASINTIEENTNQYSEPMFILGSTRFEASEVLSADAVLEAGFNHARVQSFLGEDITNIDYIPNVYYYNPDFDEWFQIKGKQTTLLDEDKAEKIEENLDIYFVNNEIKTLEVPYSGDVDEVLTEGVTHDGSKFLVPALTPKVEFKVDDEEIEVTVSKAKVDENAVVEVNGVYFTAENFAQALSVSTTENPAVLLKDMDLPTAVEVTKEITLELNGHALTVANDTEGNGVFHVLTGGKLTINGEGTVNGLGNNIYSIAIWADGGEVIINGGTYTNVGAGDDDHYDLIYAKNGGIVTINGGTFEAHTPQWTLNLKDSDGSLITVRGGTFKNYNPAAVYTEPTQPLNFVAEGYKVVVEDEIYTVVEAEDEIIVSGNSLQEAIDNAEDGAIINITKDMDLPTAVEVTKEITLELNGHALTVANDTEGNGVFHVLTGGKLTINGEGTVNGLGNNIYSIAIWADGGEVIINGGTYTNVGAGDDDHYDLIYAKNGGIVTINGGTFEAHTPQWTLNLKDSDGSLITVRGGTFKNYNPAAVYTEPTQPLNFVAEGYKVVENNGEYTVVTNA